MAKDDLTAKIIQLMKTPSKIRNMGIIAHIDHGKTTMSDSLLAGAGMLSDRVAGEARALDYLDEEQERGITIQASNVSMIHHIKGEDYMINLIDTPGHVDFGGDVTRAMRAVDGAIVVVCAVEGTMPQTETVLRQALKEKVRPIIFINKVDRLINELKLKPEDMQQRFITLISNVNEIIRTYAHPEFKEKWGVQVMEGTVAFGCAIDRWAVNFIKMKEKGITFKEIINIYLEHDEEKIKDLAKRLPLHECLLEMAVRHFPDPMEAQKYRIPTIWKGDLESPIGKALLACNADGPLVFEITKVVVDAYGEVAAGRLFSGVIKSGDTVHLNKSKADERIQQVSIYKGPQRMNIDYAIAGNIIGISGLKSGFSGETISTEPITPFEEITHIFEPVVTKAVEAKNPQDLPKLINVLREIEKEDPTVKIQINEETGEHLMSGLGELHLEWIEQKIIKYKGVNIQTSQPIVVYRESVTKLSPEFEGKSPNKHNKFYLTVEPLDKPVYEAIRNGQVEEGRIKPKDKDIWKVFFDLGMEKTESQAVRDICSNSVFLDMTKGVVQIREVLPLIMDAFEDIIKSGPICREPVVGVKIKLVDISLHEDSIHRGPAQVHPAVRQALRGAFEQAGPVLFEPVREMRIDSPVDFMGSISKLIQSGRGSMLDINQDEKRLVMLAKMPVAESFGFTSDLRSATSGKASWSLKDIKFEVLPSQLQEDVVKKIRQRKGLAEGQH